MPHGSSSSDARITLAKRLFSLEERHFSPLDAREWHQLSELEREVYLIIIDDLARYTDLWCIINKAHDHIEPR
jgi:hypothetical protein